MTYLLWFILVLSSRHGAVRNCFRCHALPCTVLPCTSRRCFSRACLWMRFFRLCF